MDRLRKLVRDDFQRQFERVHKTVQAELHAMRAAPPPTANRARLLGLFVSACIRQRGLSIEAFAHESALDPDQARVLVEGALPPDAITDDLLTRIAHSVGYEASMLRMMLGRPSGEGEATA
jgi:hypothetical protein